jgi:hypothetical protein
VLEKVDDRSVVLWVPDAEACPVPVVVEPKNDLVVGAGVTHGQARTRRTSPAPAASRFPADEAVPANRRIPREIDPLEPIQLFVHHDGLDRRSGGRDTSGGTLLIFLAMITLA